MSMLNIITYYYTLQQILNGLRDSSLTQFDALDALERLNEEGKPLGLSVSPNVILLSNKEDSVDSDLSDRIINNVEELSIDNLDDDYSSTCDDCGINIEDGYDYCSSCEKEREDQREVDRRAEELEDNRIITTRRG